MLSIDSAPNSGVVSCPDPLAVIRQATSTCHSRIESAVSWADAFSSPLNYAALLYNFYRVVEPLEARFGQFLRTPNADIAYSRTSRLRQDIETVTSNYGLETSVTWDGRESANVAYIVDRPTALGALYVLEGSALGGQILSRQLRACAVHWPHHRSTVSSALLQHSDQREHEAIIDSYFIGRGASTALHWHAFCQQLKHELADQASAQAAAIAAVQTFECFHTSLAG